MKPYQQTSSQSCLAVCLLQNIDVDITPEKELELLYEGLKTTDPYAISVVSACVKKYGRRVQVFVDNNYYRNHLESAYGSADLTFVHAKIGVTFLENLAPPYIVYINTHTLLGSWDYSPHFVTIESMTDKFFTILEPISGTRMKVSKVKLVNSALVLRDRLHYCPLVIKVIV